MRTGWRGKNLTSGQEWWHTKRADEVENTAVGLIRRREGNQGRIPGCVVRPSLLLQAAGCEMLYFADDERPEYGLSPEDLGALWPAKRLLLIHGSIAVPGREGQTVGHELGHLLLHAKGAPQPGQLGFAFEEESLSRGKAPMLFRRTAEGQFVDGRREPPWMTSEADFFAACLQMPADRYAPVAKSRLREAAQALRREAAPVEKRVDAARRHLQTIRNGDLRAYEFEHVAPGVFDTAVVERALVLLQQDHGGQVSKAAQRRRFIELGLVVDMADRLREETGQDLLSPCEFLLLSDELARGAE